MEIIMKKTVMAVFGVILLLNGCQDPLTTKEKIYTVNFLPGEGSWIMGGGAWIRYTWLKAGNS
jgi:hypothetical protein